jgi:ActR/RegA family two-component response regulator
VDAVDEYTVSLRLTLDEAQRQHVLRVLESTGGNVSEAARRLGIFRSSLQRRLRRWRP